MTLLIVLAIAAAAAEPQTHTVVMDSTAYLPASITVKVGDQVEWINKDLFPHTATSRAGRFDSKIISAGHSWTYRATRPGEFAYTCTLHPTMKGRLIVR